MKKNQLSFLVSTTSHLDGYHVKRYIGAINANVVLGTNYFSDLAASLTDVFGGYSGTYMRRMDYMYENAQNELIKKAKRLGGNAILGFKVDFDEISGKGKSMFMLSANGTACIVEQENKYSEEYLNSTEVNQNLLNLEIKKDKIIRLIDKKIVEFAEDEWNFMSEYPSKEIVSKLINNVYYQVGSETKKKIELIVSQVDSSDVVDIVYPLYMYPFEVQFYYEKKEVSEMYGQMIRNCNLFEPKYVIQLLDINLNKAIDILVSEKSFYSHDDLKTMQDICNRLDNLPDLGKMTSEKKGVFSKEEKLFYYCRNGHKNDSEVIYCEFAHCGENIKGLTKEQVSKINEFKRKVQVLDRLFINQE